MKRITAFLILGVLTLSAHADLIQKDATGVLDKLGKSSQPEFNLFLVDVGDKDSLVSGLLSVSDEFGEIEACVLSLYDRDGKKIGRVVMGAQILEKGSRNFEFNLPSSLIEKSIIQVSHRKGDDLFVVKVVLGSFAVQNPKKKS